MSTFAAEQPAGEGPLPAARKRPSLAKTAAGLAAGNTAAAVLRAVSGLLATRLVDPAVLGLFQGMNLVLGYVPLLGAGVFEGLNRELPYAFGKNDPEKARSLAGAAQAWALMIGTATAAGISAVALWHAFQGRWMEVAGWLTVAIGGFLLLFVTSYLQVLYRTNHDFLLLSRARVVQGVLSLVLVVAVGFFGFFGLCIRNLGIVLVEGLLLWRWRPLRVRAQAAVGEVGHLVKVGGPILLVDQINRLWFVLHHTLILHFMGARGLGLFFFPMIYPAVCVVPFAVHEVTYPRITELYAREGRVRPIVRYLWKPTLLLCALTFPMVVLAWLALPLATQLVLPQYVEGVGAVQWAMLEVVVLSMLPIRNVFSVVRKQHYYLAAILGGAAVYLAILGWLVRSGPSLEAFAQAFVAGRTAYVALCYFFVYVLCAREKREPWNG